MNQKLFDVAVVGNVGIDTNVYLQGPDIDYSVEANYTENIDYVGQSGGYASRGFAQLGYKTTFIGFVGDDHNARVIIDEFGHDGIDLTALFIDPSGTARSINLMYQDGRRKNFYDGKNHMHLKPELDLCREVLAKTRFVHFSIPNWARDLLPIARSVGLTISCDIQDIVSLDDPYRTDFISCSDILFFSAVNNPDPAPLINRFREIKSDQIILVGMGQKGCALGWKQGIEYFPALDIGKPVIDTNGAGDGLTVGFLTSYLLEGYTIQESVLRGQIVARYTCGLKASTSNLITKPELDGFFQQLVTSV